MSDPSPVTPPVAHGASNDADHGASTTQTTATGDGPLPSTRRCGWGWR